MSVPIALMVHVHHVGVQGIDNGSRDCVLPIIRSHHVGGCYHHTARHHDTGARHGAALSAL